MSSQDICEKAEVAILGKVAVIRTKSGGKALIGVHNLCSIAKRLKLCFENYKC
ncbi:MAG: hypothetical protein LM568_05755 [Desulfurococcaceae archaeon]|nr:hypothetical protein [Desulfurococcaceae archaeon]